MAVIKCKECGGQVSTNAEACPGCGAKQSKKTSKFTWFVLLVFVVVGYNMATRKSTPPINPPEKVASTSDRAPADSIATLKQWTRADFKDSMTDEKGQILSIRSTTSAKFEFPYNVPGGSYLTINIRKKGNAFDGYLSVNKGQMQCSYSDCHFNIRAGDGPVSTWTGLQSATNESDMMFIKDAKQFQEILKKGGRLRIGIDFFQAGNKSFDFDVGDYPGF